MSLKKKALANIIISMIIGVLLGVVLIVLSSVLALSDLIFWGLIIVGVLTIIANVPNLINGIMNIKKPSGIVDFVFAIIGIALGFMMIFEHGSVITLILGAYLIAFPIIRIVISLRSWVDQLKKEWVKILIGALLLTFLPAIMNAANGIFSLVLLVAGCVIIGLSLLFFAVSLLSYIFAMKKLKDNGPIETTYEEK